MSPETSRLVLIVIGALALAAWMAGFAFVSWVAKGKSRSRFDAVERFTLEELPEGEMLSDLVELNGEAGALSARLAALLARDGLPMYGPVQLTDVTAGRVAFESLGLPMGGRSSKVRGEVIFRPGKGGAVEAAYVVEIPGAKGLLIGAWVMSAAGLVALVATFWGIWTFVINSPSVAVRTQTFQMAQVVHLLWPPFLLAGLAKVRSRGAWTGLHAMLVNLPFATL